MDKNSVLQDAGRAVTEDSVQFKIPIRPDSGLHKWMQKKGWKPAKRSFEISPITLGNLTRISRLLLKMGVDLAEIKEQISVHRCYELAAKYPNTVPQIIALAIHNHESRPPKELIRFVRWNVNSKTMATLLAIVFKQLNHGDFINSIFLISGFSVLKSGTKP